MICYWLPAIILSHIAGLPKLANVIGETRSGLNTGDDFRFLRLAWEVHSNEIGAGDHSWALCCKGGEYSPFWDDIDVLLNWAAVISGEMISLPGARIFNTDLCFHLGIVYPMRTTSDLSPRPLPSNCCFNKGAQSLQTVTQGNAAAFIAISYTRPFKLIMEAMYGGGDVSVSGSAARNYTGGVLNKTPFPILGDETQAVLATLYNSSALIAMRTKLFDETSRLFTTPLRTTAISLSSIAEQTLHTELFERVKMGFLAQEIDVLALSAYGFGKEESLEVTTIWGEHPYAYPTVDEHDLDNHIIDRISRILSEMVSGQWSLDVVVSGSRRLVTKKGYFSDRSLEILAHTFGINPLSIAPLISTNVALRRNKTCEVAARVLSFAIGCAFGRWDVRSTQNVTADEPPVGPFDPLPICSPAQLLDLNGLPASESPTDYPLSVSWHGILSDDADHGDDIVRYVHAVFEYVWPKSDGSSVAAIEHEACDILGIADLRGYFRKPSYFFSEHLKMYSRSRRQAPIYWPLSTSSGSYTLWLYYHRLNADTLYTAVNRFVGPKLVDVGRTLSDLETKLAEASGREATRLRAEADAARAFLAELREFRDELLRVAALPYRPDLNDGVIINAAPLHKLFRLPKWAKDTRECWEKLQRGDYDWAHLAYNIWPDRVREKCRTDRSLAIAHDLESLYEQPAATVRKRGRAVVEAEGEEE